MTQNRSLIIGIDPGQNGGIVSLTSLKTSNDVHRHITTIDSMPRSPKELMSYWIDVLGLSLAARWNDKVIIAVERVHSFPGMSSQSTFSFGKHLGHLEATLAAIDHKGEVKWINPEVWMKHYDMKREKGEKSNDWKKRLVKLAKSMVDKEYKDQITLKTADAFLIANYALEEYIKKEQ